MRKMGGFPRGIFISIAVITMIAGITSVWYLEALYGNEGSETNISNGSDQEPQDDGTEPSTVHRSDVPGPVDGDRDSPSPVPEPTDDEGPEEPVSGPPDLMIQLPKQWTSMFYVAYDNSIGPMEAWESDLHYLEGTGSSEEVNLVALVDQEVEGDCEVLFIRNNGSYHYPVSEMDPELPDELDTGDPVVLYLFVTWAMRTFPAEKYDLHFMDHGAGWWGAGTDEGNDSFLESWEISEALGRAAEDNGHRIDVLSFDACFMANMEFGYQVSQAVDILVGYEPMAVGDQNNEGYLTGNIEVKEIWSALIGRPEMSPEEFAALMVSTANIIGPYLIPQLGMSHIESSDTVGAFHLTFYQDLKEAMDSLSKELFENVTGENEVLAERQLILEIIGTPGSGPDMNTESFSGQSELVLRETWKLYDMYDFVKRLSEGGTLLCGNETASKVLEVLDRMIIACSHGERYLRGEHPDAHGLTIYIPFRNTNRMDLYERTDWARDTCWDEFLSEVPWDQ